MSQQSTTDNNQSLSISSNSGRNGTEASDRGSIFRSNLLDLPFPPQSSYSSSPKLQNCFERHEFSTPTKGLSANSLSTIYGSNDLSNDFHDAIYSNPDPFMGNGSDIASEITVQSTPDINISENNSLSTDQQMSDNNDYYYATSVASLDNSLGSSGSDSTNGYYGIFLPLFLTCRFS